MNEQFTFTTPRRRHSLFERMESQIQRISKKLSAAKETLSKSKGKNDKTRREFRANDQASWTIRQPKKSQNFFEDRTHTKDCRKQQQQRKLNLSDRNCLKGSKLQAKRQNEKLQDLCEYQAFKIGYMRASYRKNAKQAERKKEQLIKENIYLQKLMEYYKDKALKYKNILHFQSSEQN